MPEADTSERFTELAPWYVNGTASDSDRAWIEQYVHDHPLAQAELEWYQSLQKQFRDEAPDVAPDIGLPRLLHRIRNERRRSEHVPMQDKRFGGFSGVQALVASWLARPSYAFAAVALLVLQAGVIGALAIKHQSTEQEYAEFRSLATVPATGPLLRVSFKPDARESDIRYALVDVGGVLVGGPGQLGEYLVRVPAQRLDAAVGVLSSNAAVEAVEISVPRSP